MARHGAAGERKTAHALERALPAGVVILHDLNIPIPGFKANIDHVVVSGRIVTIVDSKSWAGGIYWSWKGVTRRGLSRFKPAEKQTMVLAARSISTLLSRMDLDAAVGVPLVVVWPTSGAARLSLAQFPGAKLVHGHRLGARAKKLIGTQAADRAVVDALMPLVK